MNVHTNPKSVHMTVELTEQAKEMANAEVAKLANDYANAEKHLRLAIVSLNKMSARYAAIHKDAQAIGYLEYVERSARNQAVSGQVASVLQQVVVHHMDDTERAKELGIDIPVLFSGPGR